MVNILEDWDELRIKQRTLKKNMKKKKKNGNKNKNKLNTEYPPAFLLISVSGSPFLAFLDL